MSSTDKYIFLLRMKPFLSLFLWNLTSIFHSIETLHKILCRNFSSKRQVPCSSSSFIFHLINPSFQLSCPIRPVIPPYLLLCTLLFLYLTNNRINLLCTGISLHTLQIISLFLQQLCPITHILNLALVKLHIL